MVGRQGEKQSIGAQGAASSLGPSQCGSRGRAADAADAVKGMAVLINKMDPEVVRRMVHAREAAAGVYKAFPEGDRRFASLDSESEDDGDDETEVVSTEVEDDVVDAGDVGDVEFCRGLFDLVVDNSPRLCLLRAKEVYGIDLVAEMDRSKLDFFARIRLVNLIRRMVDEGQAAEDSIRRVRDVLSHGDDPIFRDDALLVPVIEGDVLLTVLESGHEDDCALKNEYGDDINEALEESLRESSIVS